MPTLEIDSFKETGNIFRVDDTGANFEKILSKENGNALLVTVDEEKVTPKEIANETGSDLVVDFRFVSCYNDKLTLLRQI